MAATPGGVVVDTFFTIELRVKTLTISLIDGGAKRCYPLGGVFVELFSSRPRSVIAGGKFWFFFAFLFIFNLLCKRVSSSPCIGSAVCCFIYKVGRKPVSSIAVDRKTLWEPELTRAR
jgi:hypothetical protein